MGDLMPGLPSHAEAGAEHARHAAGRSGGPTPSEILQESAKPVSTDAAGNTNQGMSVALSADGSTAIVGGPGPNNVDRDRSPSRGPAGAAIAYSTQNSTTPSLSWNAHSYGGAPWRERLPMYYFSYSF